MINQDKAKGWLKGVPDADITVLMRVQDEEEPVWIGFWDGEAWRNADASVVLNPVLGWMHLHHVAATLDMVSFWMESLKDGEPEVKP